MSDSTSRGVNLGNTYGAFFIGYILKSILYGMSIAQTWTYFCSKDCRRNDPTVMKVFIALITVLNTLHVVFSACLFYWYLVQNFGNIENLVVDHWSMEAQTNVNTFLAFMIQLFYARRLYLMSKSIVLVMIIVGLTVFNFATGIVFAVREHILRRYSRESSSIWLSFMGMGGFLMLDSLIAVSMFWCLYRMRTGYARTDAIVTTLMIYIVSSGVLTSILGAASVISFAAAPHTLISELFYMPFGTCYVNSLLALLNNRDLIRKGSITDDLKSDNPNPQTMQTPMIIVSMHRTATMGLAVSKHDPDMEANALESKRLESCSTASVHEESPSSDA